MLAALGQGLGQEASLRHAQQLEAVTAHLSLKLTNLGNGGCCDHPPRQPMAPDLGPTQTDVSTRATQHGTTNTG